jgi:hypothetical protein
MQTPNTSSLWNAGWWRFVAIVAYLAAGGGGKAQVPNDDCAGGFFQGIQMLPALSYNCSDIANGMGVLINDSTDLAIPNFPYPCIPLPCSGFTTSVAAPAKDRWYAFRVHCDLEFTATCSDTCHISFWSGSDCAALVPLACYTLLPNSPVNGMVFPPGPTPFLDTLSMQISGNGVVQDVNYMICLLNPHPPCIGFPVSPAPTPVVCFTYDTVVTPNSSLSEPNGAIAIEMQLGNSPFTIQWNMGDDSFALDNLAAGVYDYIITDGSGCTESGSITVDYDPSATIAEAASCARCGLAYDSRTNELVFEPGWPGKSAIQLTDVMGRLVWGREVSTAHARIHLPALTPGIQIAIIRTPQKESCMFRFTVP